VRGPGSWRCCELAREPTNADRNNRRAQSGRVVPNYRRPNELADERKRRRSYFYDCRSSGRESTASLKSIAVGAFAAFQVGKWFRRCSLTDHIAVVDEALSTSKWLAEQIRRAAVGGTYVSRNKCKLRLACNRVKYFPYSFHAKFSSALACKLIVPQ
jgi:hypothetical protein